MQIRTLLPADAADFQALRLRGLRETPGACARRWGEGRAQPVESVAERIATNRDGFILGAFEGAALVGVVGMQRERHLKHAHKMVLWGMYVVPDARGRGVGRRLVDEALRQAFARPGIRQVNLGVNAANAPALALYEAAGFTSFGLERGCMIVDGELQDELYMVCVRPGG